MKLNVKRVHCDSCKKLVRGIEKKQGEAVTISCSKCGKVLRTLERAIWRS